VNLPVLFDRSPWGLVVVSGPDGTSFLQAIVSQDLDPVADGATVPSLLLHPQGKLEVAFRATRVGDDWWLDTDPEYAAHLAESLSRYKIRVKADIDDRSAGTGLASAVVAAEAETPSGSGGLRAIPTEWGAAEGFDVLGPLAEVQAWLEAAPYRRGTADELEVLRIEAGVPKQGVDVDAVSFTKGCFIGQELVCRIDSRGHVNRFLRRLALPGTSPPPAGADVSVDGRVVGQVTSAAAVPGDERVVALAMIRREIEPPADVQVGWDDTTVDASVLT
jgi:folate-binding Fe-S cluster repair protein YgfZ